ncbi:hypothetical protein DFV88_24800 [Salmonella enterica subsp. enterica serovar Newport]|nr:hypothetical protein [Salmonella enterica subsp. enterica serovar Newport]
MIERFYKHNYEIKTPLQIKFWSSAHRDNRIKAIIAFSLDYDNANDNLRRAGYTFGYRHKKLEEYKQYINHYDFADVPYSTITE